MPRPKPLAPSVLDIKHAVRERDGFRCTRCGMTNEEHRSIYGRRLDVHRLVPGSLYTVEGCTTLCRPCHGSQPKCRHDRPGLSVPRRPANIRIPDDLLSELEYIAEALKADLSHVIRAILAEHTPTHVERARDIRDHRERVRKATGEE